MNNANINTIEFVYKHNPNLVRNIDKEVGVFLNNYLTPILSYTLAILTIFFSF